MLTNPIKSETVPLTEVLEVTSTLTVVLSVLAPKWVRLDRNEINLGLFKKQKCIEI